MCFKANIIQLTDILALKFKYCLLKARQRGAIYQLKGKIASVEISKRQLSMTLQSIVSVLVENPSLTGCSYKMFANPDGKAS